MSELQVLALVDQVKPVNFCKLGLIFSNFDHIFLKQDRFGKISWLCRSTENTCMQYNRLTMRCCLMTKTILSTIVLSTILLTSMIATTPAFAVPTWSASGPGTVTVTDADQGGDGLAQFTYAADPAGFATNTWTFETTATTTGPVTVFYDWGGFHAWFQVTATLEATDPSGTTTLINEGPVSCCVGAPSGGFHYTGSHTFDAVAGQTYSFTISGSNSDSDNRLLGTFTVASPPTFGLDGFAQQVTDLEDDLAACQAQNSQLTSDLDQCEADNADLQQTIDDQNDTIADLQQQVDDQNDIIAGLEDAIAALTTQVEDLTAQIADLTGILTNGETDMCHKGKTITVGLDAISAHLNHGDSLGACS